MNLDSISIENPNHQEDFQEIFTPLNQPKDLNDEEKQKFIEQWLNCEVSLTDWYKAPNIDVNNLLINSEVTNNQKKIIYTRQLQLHEWFLQYRTFAKVIRLNTVSLRTPFFLQEFVRKEIIILKKYLSNKITETDFGMNNKIVYGIDKYIDIPKAKAVMDKLEYQENYDIHNPHGVTEVESINRYCKILEEISKNDINIDTSSNIPTNDLSKYFYELVDFSVNILIKYKHEVIKKDTHTIDMVVLLTVSGFSESSEFENKINSLYKTGLKHF